MSTVKIWRNHPRKTARAGHVCEPVQRDPLKVGDQEYRHGHPYCRICGRAMKGAKAQDRHR